MHRPRIAGFAVPLAVLLLAASVPAYLVRRAGNGAEVTWDLATSAPNVVGGKITYYIDEETAQDVSTQQFADAVRAGVQAWEDVPDSDVAFLEDPGRATSQKNSTDRINRIGYTDGLLGAFTFGVTFTRTVNNRITDSDVVLNPQLVWSVSTPGTFGKADIQSVIAHEWGHGIGLDHVPNGNATMFFGTGLGTINLRTLAPDDEAAVIHAYPAASAATARGVISGTVTVPGTADRRGIQVTAIDFATGKPAASAFTEPDGTYAVEGLAEGVYRIVASPIGKVRLAQGVFGDYWDSADTSFLPAVRGQDGATDGSTGVHFVSAGGTLPGIDLTVGPADDPLEPNDARATASAFAVGRSVAARMESNNDRDYYAFSANTGQKVSLFLHSFQLGTDLDARINIKNGIGATLAENDDIQADYTGIGGTDVDCRILDFTIPLTGTYYAYVEPVVSPDAANPQDFFYVLTLLSGGGTPSPYTSEMTAAPAVVPADGESASTITFTPRSLTGGASGPGLDVTFERVSDGDPDGDLGIVLDHGDGTYSATITAPESGGSDTVRALVDDTPIAAVTVTWRGVADFASSDFTASPRRVRFDGASTSTVTLVPRDAHGVPFGPGATVDLFLDGDPAAGLGATADGGDGSYTATLTAGTAEETIQVGAEVEGETLEGTLAVEVGFPLEAVVDDAVADLVSLLAADPAPPLKSIRKLEKARDLLAAVADFPAATDTEPILNGLRKGVKQIEVAAKKGAAVLDLAEELAEAARQAAGKAIDDATPFADEAREQKSLLKASMLFDKGEALLDAGAWSKASVKYRAAVKQTLKVAE